MAHDRRASHPVGAEDLAWLLDMIWPSATSEARVTGDDPVARATRMLTLPGRSRPWVVAPDLGLGPGLRALGEGRHLLTRRQRALRGIAAAGLLTGLARRSACRIEVPAGRDDLLERLSHQLGGPVAPIIHLGEADPNRKPTLQLVDPAGTTVGYAKVGWNEPTRAMVRREGVALGPLAGPLAGDRLRVPEVLVSARYDDLALDVLVTAPMPAAARRLAADSSPDDRMIRSIATATAAGGRLVPGPAYRSTWWSDLAARTARVAAWASGEAATVRRALDQVVAALPEQAELTLGGWHGDLVPWNLALAGADTWIWDWEHTGPGRPVGLDLLHASLAGDLHVRRVPLADAVRGVYETAASRLPGLGVAPALTGAVAFGYLVERWLRAAELAGAGGDWDAGVHPGIVLALPALAPRGDGPG